MKIAITAGGGGHFAPVIPILEALSEKDEVIVIGRKYAFEADNTLSFEFRTATERNIPFVPLTTGRLQRSFTTKTALSLAKIPQGLMEAYMVLRKFRPDVVLSFGGYVSVPVVFAARSLSIPIVIHEQTFEAGLSNRLVARFASKICVSWETSLPFFPKKKTILTGNPIRKEFLSDKKDPEDTFFKENKSVPIIGVIGGSLGSHAINTLIADSLQLLLSQFALYHQTGDAQEFQDFAMLENKKKQLSQEIQSRYCVTKFISIAEIASVLSAVDVVVSRAGINTVTELLYLKKPTVLIPLETGQKNEQVTNAEFMKDIGICEVLRQKAATPEELLSSINRLLRRKEEKKEDKLQQRERHAAKQIVDILYETTKNTK